MADSMDLPLAKVASLEEILDEFTIESASGDLWADISGDRIKCYACGHRCNIPPGCRGI